MKFSQTDLQQIKSKGISESAVNTHIELFENGIPFTNIAEAATIGNGIIALDETLIDAETSRFEDKKDNLNLVKFVPASGAATRMFKFLFKFLDEYNPKEQSINSFINKNKLKDMSLLLVGIEKLPFYDQILQYLNNAGIRYNDLSLGEKIWHFVNTMLTEDQLNFGNQPKGLLPFHKYKTEHISTAFEEHLYEAALYASSGNIAKLHFTISERHKDKFDGEFKRIEEYVEQHTGVSFDISFSYQQESTDTIAVTLDNEPFREDNGSILFRPSGHGALLKNLDTINADIIFIKNIDNVVVKQYKDELAKYKKVLAGILIKLQEKAFEFLHTLDKDVVSERQFNTIETFLEQEMSIRISREYKKYQDQYKIEYLREKLNRPIRICGMVKNEGEPGGGPFWVRDQYGNYALQIVESAQIDLKNTKQNSILQNATHFNPVDLVCGVKNYKGEKFDLDNYVDHNAAFITNKTKAGKDLKALELPGLWNGSMAFWTTIFVEVPIITFNPVKTVNDLLKAPHQLK
jgi:Asp-tRNA(Asn)/Glu-tRNA(Gln) amidotransferase C subunit